MTLTIVAETEALEINPNTTDRISLAAAAELYCKHLDKMGKAATDMGRTQDAANYEQEATKWRDELVVPVDDGERVTFYPRHMAVLEKGSIFLASNMKAARGTLKPFREFDGVIEDLKTRADYVLNTLSVAFTPIMAGQAADDGAPSENVDRDCPACGETFVTAADSPDDQECLKCLVKRGAS